MRKSTSVPAIGQGNNFICWAAYIAIIRNYRFSQWTVTPSDIVNNSPVFPGSFNARNFSDIRDTIYPYFIGTLNTHYSSLTPSIVISEIDSNSPLYLHTESATATNNDIDDSLYHPVVGYGYYTSATTDRLWIIDPYAEDHEGGYLSITYDNSSTYGTYRLGGTANGGLMEVWYTITY
jgi:hypothetical protein